MSCKRLQKLICCGAGAVVAVGAMAKGALVIDLRAVSATGGAVVGGSKIVSAYGVSGPVTVTMNVVGVTTDNTPWDQTDNGVLAAHMSFLSSNGGLSSSLIASRASTFTATGSSNGTIRDLDIDGDLDVGSNTPSSAAGFFSVRSSTAPMYQAGNEVILGVLSLTTAGGFGDTAVNARPRAASVGATWFENGVGVTSSVFSAGSPVWLILWEPEPTSLAGFGLAGIGLLARRRARG